MGMFTESPLFEDPSLPTGWYRKVVQRQTGATAGQWDVYVYNPEGKKFRSRNELRSHFIQIGSTMNSEDFDFSVKGKGHHNKDGPAASGEATGGGEQRKTKIRGPNVNNSNQTSVKKVTLKRKLDEKNVVRTPSASSAIRPKTTVTKKLATSKNLATTIANKPAIVELATPVEHDKSSHYFSAHLHVLPQKKDARVPSEWEPPQSPYRFIQEFLYRDPWQLLVATIFLNKTNGKVATPLVWEFLKRWPTAEAAQQADWKEIAELMNPLGLHQLRAKRIIRMSEDYLKKSWVTPSELYGISKYGQDSYRIFCLGEWREVRPTDIMLKIYQDWLLTNSKALKLADWGQS